MNARLDADLIAAHRAGDGRAMVALYVRAADQAGPEARAFFLTQAMVFALEAGDHRAEALRADLIALGKEAPLLTPAEAGQR